MIKISGKYDSAQVSEILKDYAAKRMEDIVKKEYYELIFPDAHKIYDLENVITDIGTQKRLVVDEAQSRYPRFVLTGDPGSGKSTLLFNLYSNQSERLLAGDSFEELLTDEQTRGILPIFIELNMYNSAEREEKKGLEYQEGIGRIVRQSSLTSLGFAMHMRGETRASSEIVYEKLAKNIMMLETKKIIKKGTLGAADVFRDLKSFGFIEEKSGMVKFFHPSFMEYFAAMNIKEMDRGDALRFADEINWEEVMNFYYGLIDDCSYYVEYFLKHNHIFDASNCIIFGETKNEELIEQVIWRLAQYLDNKYEYFRKKAEEHLLKIDHPRAVLIFKKFYKEFKDRKPLSAFYDLYMKTPREDVSILPKKTVNGKDIFLIGEEAPEYKRDNEFEVLWAGFVKDELKGDPLEKLEKWFSEMTDLEYTNELKKIVKDTDYSFNSRWYAVYFLELMHKKWGIDILFDIMPKRNIKKFILDVEGLKETYITRKYILLNFLIDRRVDVRIRRALAVNHINDLGKDGITYDIMNFIEHNFSRNQEVHSGVFSLIIESLFYLDANVAEEYLILLLKRFRNNKKIASELTGAIQNRTVSEKHYKFFVAYLKEEKKPAIRQNIIQILTNTKDSQFVIPFLSLIKDPKESVVMKKKAIEAIGEVGDNHIIPMLKELSVDSNPDIYNSAFTALKKIERRSAFEESYLLKTDIREVNITEEEIDTLLFDEEKRFPKVKIFKDNKEVIEVEYVMINLGPISGLIFYIIATNARIDRPINIDVISAKLDESSIFIDKTRIKGRIAAIRKMMREKLGDKVDPYFLIENVRRFGYRLNASVSIE